MRNIGISPLNCLRLTSPADFFSNTILNVDVLKPLKEMMNINCDPVAFTVDAAGRRIDKYYNIHFLLCIRELSDRICSETYRKSLCFLALQELVELYFLLVVIRYSFKIDFVHFEFFFHPVISWRDHGHDTCHDAKSKAFLFMFYQTVHFNQTELQNSLFECLSYFLKTFQLANKVCLL